MARLLGSRDRQSRRKRGATIDTTFSLPPAANNMYVNVPGRGRVKSRAYKDWRETVGWTLKAKRLGRVEGKYSFEMHVFAGDRADIDARSKAALDLFVWLGLTPDDRHCVSLNVIKMTDTPKGLCRVIIREAT